MGDIPSAMRIDAEAVYDDGTLLLALGLTSATLTRARRNRELRYTRKGKRNLYLGRWVLDWLASETAVSQ